MEHQTIRKTKTEIATAQKMGVDTTQLRLKLGQQQASLKAFVDEKKLVRQPRREKAYAIGAQPRALRKVADGAAPGYIPKHLRNTVGLPKSKSPIDIQTAVKGTNPHFAPGTPYGENCQRCVPVYELRRRGFDVTAKPKPKPDTIDFAHDCFENVTLTNATTPKKLVDALDKLPNGARVAIRQNWPGKKRRGHVYVAERVNGNTIWIDPQDVSRNEAYVAAYPKRARRGTIQWFRMDDADFKQGLDFSLIADW
jgi:hypothetical protein